MRKAYKTLTLRISRRAWHFIVRYVVLAGAVIAGLVVLYFAGHREYESLIGAGGLARALELAGEAAADAVAEDA